MPLATGEIGYLTVPSARTVLGASEPSDTAASSAGGGGAGWAATCSRGSGSAAWRCSPRGCGGFRDAGCARAGLGVDAANPTGAVGRYERLGFHTVRTTTTWAEQVGAQGLAPSRVGQS